MFSEANIPIYKEANRIISKDTRTKSGVSDLPLLAV